MEDSRSKRYAVRTWLGITVAASMTFTVKDTCRASIVVWHHRQGITIGDSNTFTVNYTSRASIIICPLQLVGTWFGITVRASNTFTVNYTCWASIVVCPLQLVGTWFGITVRASNTFTVNYTCWASIVVCPLQQLGTWHNIPIGTWTILEKNSTGMSEWLCQYQQFSRKACTLSTNEREGLPWIQIKQIGQRECHTASLTPRQTARKFHQRRSEKRGGEHTPHQSHLDSFSCVSAGLEPEHLNRLFAPSSSCFLGQHNQFSTSRRAQLRVGGFLTRPCVHPTDPRLRLQRAQLNTLRSVMSTANCTPP